MKHRPNFDLLLPAQSLPSVLDVALFLLAVSAMALSVAANAALFVGASGDYAKSPVCASLGGFFLADAFSIALSALTLSVLAA